MIAGLEAVTGGAILVGGTDVTELPPHRRDTSIMFQDYALFPHKTLADNVSYGLKMRGISRAKRDAAAQEWLARIGLPGMARDCRISFRRTAPARGPCPLADHQSGRASARRAPGCAGRKPAQADAGELKHLHREVGLTFVYVTHDQEEALTMSDRIAVMHDGAIEQLSPPQTVYDRPGTEFVARFIGHCNVVHAIVSEAATDMRCAMPEHSER